MLLVLDVIAFIHLLRYVYVYEYVYLFNSIGYIVYISTQRVFAKILLVLDVSVFVHLFRCMYIYICFPRCIYPLLNTIQNRVYV